MPEQSLLIRDVTPWSPAFNRMKTLYLKNMCTPSIHFCTLQAKESKAYPPAIFYIVLPLLVCTCNCYIPSRKINHHGALLYAFILCPHVQRLFVCPEHLKLVGARLARQTTEDFVMNLADICECKNSALGLTQRSLDCYTWLPCADILHCKPGKANTRLIIASCEAGPGTTLMCSIEICM